LLLLCDHSVTKLVSIRRKRSPGKIEVCATDALTDSTQSSNARLAQHRRDGAPNPFTGTKPAVFRFDITSRNTIANHRERLGHRPKGVKR